MPAYYSGRDGDPFTDAVMHATRDCPELQAADGSARPVADETVALLDAVAWCPECASDRATETCAVEKADGEICGRERPCPYHD